MKSAQACVSVCVFYSFKISLQLSIIHTQRATHLTRAHALHCALSTPQGVSVCACACVHLALYTAA